MAAPSFPTYGFSMTQGLSPSPRISLPEFIALLAMLTATVAFSIDAMLPALPEIARELTPSDPNNAQLILTSFVLGMGVGTFVAGPMSDAWGRRAVVMIGAVLFCAGAMLAWAGTSLETVLAGRILQGVGAAGPRIIAMATVRDIYSGRQMARIMSFVMMIFTIVPAAAPLIGAQIIAFTGWRGIFIAFVLFMLLAATWYGTRLGETLPPEKRRPFRMATLISGAKEVLSHRTVQIAIGMQALQLAALFGTISQIQPLFETTFGRGETFPFWFAMIALISGGASLLNAQLVVRFGMRRLVKLALGAQLALALTVALLLAGEVLTGTAAFALFLVFVTGIFFMVGFIMGNINAIAMEPLGHLAGMAASLMAALSTVIGVAFAAPLGLAFDGTVMPLALGITGLSAAALVLQVFLPKSTSAPH
ncbi:multidrug effflux MFS transporter [Falsigemmobacter faecalis]|nr:multidrug effflux MFS transporter [Falsigemmobacter faecalis]